MTDWVKVTTGPTVKAMADIDRRADRATMYGLRAVGRRVKQEARRRAPVYQGQSGARVQFKNYAQFSRFQKTTGYRGGVANSVVVPGLLKNSIASSRRLKKVGDAYRLGIAPRGDRVHLYSGQMEARYHYMAGGHEAALAEMEQIFVAAWMKATTPR